MTGQLLEHWSDMQTTTSLSMIDLYLCLNRIHINFEYTNRVQDREMVKIAMKVVCKRAQYIESIRGAK